MKKIALQLSLYSIVFMVACSTNKTTEKEEKYSVANPLVLDTVYTNAYVAEIQAMQNVEIRARIKGYVEKLFVDEGQTVHQGQLLFTISSKGFQQELQKAKSVLKSAIAELKSAEIELESTQKLADKDFISKPELGMMKAKVEALSAKVEEAQSDEAQAELNLSYTEIKAPFDGIINRIPHKTGSLVEDGTLLTSISNNKEVFAYFKLSETDYLTYIADEQQGKYKEVSLMLANNSPYQQKGIIETVEGEFDKATGNIAFRAKFPNPKQILKHGSSGKVLVKNQLKNALLIPQKSTFEIQENIYCFVVDKKNVVQLRKIVPSVRLSELYVVASGLSVNDKFIYEGLQKVKEGDKITTETVQITEFKTH